MSCIPVHWAYLHPIHQVYCYGNYLNALRPFNTFIACVLNRDSTKIFFLQQQFIIGISIFTSQVSRNNSIQLGHRKMKSHNGNFIQLSTLFQTVQIIGNNGKLFSCHFKIKISQILILLFVSHLFDRLIWSMNLIPYLL